MRIVHISAEFAPIAKAGGLGEVVLGLSRVLQRKGNDVEVILPYYDFIPPLSLANTKRKVTDFECLGEKNTAWEARVEDCRLILLEEKHPKAYFRRGKIYSCADDPERFLYFTRVALEYLRGLKQPIDVLHLHDWHVSAAAALVKEVLKELCVQTIFLTIHNVEYQGKCEKEVFASIGLDPQYYATAERFLDPLCDQINLLKGGIVYADRVIAVSPTYAKEILTEEYGFHLEKTLQKHKGKLLGVLNGIDTKIWNPMSDVHLGVQYDFGSLQKTKKVLKTRFSSLDQTRTPWIGTVSRLVPQKGIELLEEAIETTLKLGGNFLLLGSSPIEEIQRQFDQLKEKYRDNPAVYLNYTYDEKIAHQIYGALDFLLVPSRFEPCGLTQMIAMRYGAVPVVRATGGLSDTVFDAEDYRIPSSKRNGFSFQKYSKEAMNDCLQRAFSLYRKEAASFRNLIRRGMASDFSWKESAQKYLKLYCSAIEKKSSLEEKRFFLRDESAIS